MPNASINEPFYWKTVSGVGQKERDDCHLTACTYLSPSLSFRLDNVACVMTVASEYGSPAVNAA